MISEEYMVDLLGDLSGIIWKMNNTSMERGVVCYAELLQERIEELKKIHNSWSIQYMQMGGY